MNLTPTTTTTTNTIHFTTSTLNHEAQDSETLEFSLTRLAERMVKLDDYYNPQPIKHKASTISKVSDDAKTISVASEAKQTPAKAACGPLTPPSI